MSTASWAEPRTGSDRDADPECRECGGSGEVKLSRVDGSGEYVVCRCVGEAKKKGPDGKLLAEPPSDPD